jgi:hypothetical protein
MEPHLIIIEEIMVMAVDMIGNEGDVLKILQERIPHLTIEMRITMKKKNMEMDEVYKINPQKPMKEKVIGVV